MKIVCAACHQTPGIPFAKIGNIGPLLVAKTSVAKRLASHEYQVQVKAGLAHAKIPKEYIIESIVHPSAFIVPGFPAPDGKSLMPEDYGQRFTYAAVEKLADYLLTLDCESAKKEGLNGPDFEPRSKICGN